MADDTAGVRSGPRFPLGRTWRRWLTDMLLISGGIVSVIFEPFSIAVHSIVGLVFAGAVGPHLWHRRTWIRATLSRLWRRGRLSARLRWGLAQSLLLLVLILTATASGLYDWLDTRSRIRWHAISSVVLIVVVTRHAWTRRQWLLRRRRG
jgi:hypothetical protein